MLQPSLLHQRDTNNSWSAATRETQYDLLPRLDSGGTDELCRDVVSGELELSGGMSNVF